jgi:predicted AlkP superfamily phosphohydrolase/phosphomutase
MTVRTLFIGLDGATFTVLNDLTKGKDGEPPVMPFMAKVFADGVRCKLRSTPNPLTPPAWVSLMTGRGPGHHGVAGSRRSGRSPAARASAWPR